MIEAMSVDMKEYWCFQVTSMEGAWLLQKIGRGTQTKDPKAVIAGSDGISPIILMKKSIFSAEDIHKVLGIPLEQLLANKGVIKVGTKKDPSLPKPTVDYYGEA